jgi:UDP-GlcNAc:undecaprenyl-phosphate GlcNAc-1-phosphate transferase
VLRPLAQWVAPVLGNENLVVNIPLPGGEIPIDIIYWAGTAVIAIFVLGGCNAANLLDGLDGLLSGVVAVIAIGLLCVSLLMAIHPAPADVSPAHSLAGARIVLCLAVLGAALGFLPHNFNPASIFLGDCGSHLLGYSCVVIILMFGEFGQTHLVFAGLIIFSVPIIDTTLAIIRRWLAGRPMSVGDDQHMHHQLKRALGGVQRAVFAMYGIATVFAIVGVTLAALVMMTALRVRVVYAIAMVMFVFIGVIAVKTARRERQLGSAPARKP